MARPPRPLRTKMTRGFERLLTATRRQGLAKKPWRYRNQRAVKKLTYDQRKKRREKREEDLALYQSKISEVHQLIVDKATEIRELIGTHSLQYIIDDIYQMNRLKSNSKKVGPFNAFVSLEMEKINARTQNILLLRLGAN